MWKAIFIGSGKGLKQCLYPYDNYSYWAYILVKKRNVTPLCIFQWGWKFKVVYLCQKCTYRLEIFARWLRNIVHHFKTKIANLKISFLRFEKTTFYPKNWKIIKCLQNLLTWTIMSQNFNHFDRKIKKLSSFQICNAHFRWNFLTFGFESFDFTLQINVPI